MCQICARSCGESRGAPDSKGGAQPRTYTAQPQVSRTSTHRSPQLPKLRARLALLPRFTEGAAAAHFGEAREKPAHQL
jgi:hypothetical protein